MLSSAPKRKALITAALAAALFSPFARAKDPPPFQTIEITRFTKNQGVELTPNFIDYFYEALFQSKHMREIFAQSIGENEAVSPAEGPRTITLRGNIIEYGKGSHAKSMLIGFGVGRRSLVADITLFRRMDNATIYTAQLKVRAPKNMNEKLLAPFMAKELAGALKDKREEIQAALREADRRYIPPKPAAVVEKVVKLDPPAPVPAPTPEPAAKAEVKVEEPPEPPAAKEEVAPKAEAPARKPSEEMGTVEVTSTFEGAEVYVDDFFVGNAPAMIKLAPGKHTVRVVMAGEEDWKRELSVLPGSELKLLARHTARAPAPKPLAAPPDPKALSKREILDLLTNFIPNARIAALVAEHGVKFKPTAADLSEIEDAGGDNNLLETIRKARGPT